MAEFVKGARGPMVGLDIGTNYIKIVEARLGRGGVEVTALGVFPTPSNVIENNLVLDPQALGQAIKEALRRTGVSSKRVVSSVAGQSSLVVRIIAVPKMTLAELKETMRWEVERHVPFAAEQTIMDYEPLSPPDRVADGANMDVLLAVAQEDLIHGHVASLQAADLQAVAIDIEPLASSRALLELANGASGIAGTVAVADLGANTSDISIFQDGLIRFTRSTPLAGNALTRAIGEHLGQPQDQAERLKKEMGHVPESAASMVPPELDTDLDGESTAAPLGSGAEQTEESSYDFAAGGLGGGRGFIDTSGSPGFEAGESDEEDAASRPRQVFDLSDEPEESSTGAPMGSDPTSGASEEDYLRSQISDAMLPILGELVTELRRSMDYFRSQSGASVDRMLISGGTAKLPGLVEFLRAQLGMPVELANPMGNVSVVAKLDGAYLSEVAPVFPVSVGLAVREMLADTSATRK